ncbi:MAG: S41 family peptidase [Polyangiales bacterium]
MRRYVLPALYCAAGIVAMLAGAGCRSNKRAAGDEPASASASALEPGGRKWPKADLEDEPPPDDPPRRQRPIPTGAPPRLSCTSTRALIDDVLARLAAPPEAIVGAQLKTYERNLADATLDWADPHGLWTASPDSPVVVVLRARAAKLRSVLDGKGDCPTELRPIGEAMVKWVAELRTLYDEGAKEGAKSAAGTTLDEAVSEAAFEDGPVTQPARELAKALGRRTAAAVALQPALATEAALAKDRWLPVLDADAWAEVMLAAAVRAYVPMLDPHGAWAPSDEASILYDRDLELAPPPRIWGEATRTVLGVRIDQGAVAPLEERDVVLAVDGVALAGLSAESIDQLAEAADGGDAQPRILRVVRKQKVLNLELRSEVAGDESEIAFEGLPIAEVPYGGGLAIVMRITDVPDALGDDVARALATARADAGSKTIEGVVLDLRGNGGGSIEGATGAIGVFLAGVPLFPLKHRDGAIETERAAEPPLEDRFAGPVAVLVDGGTASAAEMIAGALHAYRRGVVIGTTTYGKGCAQEYVDDVTATGVLRITTLLFALPDGSPVQRVGLHPDIALALPAPPGLKDHEADLVHAPPSWTGPDVRDLKKVGEVAWPAGKTIGPCTDDQVCKALRLLGAAKPLSAKK